MIVITGASKGIGKYIMDYFIAKGEQVIGFYNSTKPSSNIDHYISVDVTDQNAIKSFVENTKLENIVLINAAGVTLAGIAHKCDVDKFEKTLKANTIGAFSMIRYLLPLMREQNYGRIINISSVVAQIGTPGNVAYSASKAALWGMSKVVAMENATKGITSNCLNLGYCSIGMVETIPQDVLAKIIDSIPQKRLCEPHNITNAIEFLIASDYVTGSQIDINGGQF
ncbi:MAG: SDR family oxidoreductase [Muribaculaceae bacterium]